MYHLKRTSVAIGQDVYYTGGQNWSDDFSARKIFSSLTEVNTLIAPTTRIIGNAEVSNANGGFKNAVVVEE